MPIFELHFRLVVVCLHKMAELIRDTVLGHFLRMVTGKKVLLYEEEKNPELWRKYIHEEKSGNMAKYGQTSAPDDENSDQQDTDDSPARSASSGSTVVDRNQQVNEVSGKPVDPEKGRDVHIVDWWGPDDPENPRNWSRFKRCWVTFCICKCYIDFPRISHH